jgi:opacity protein-like surface antigen
MKILYIKRKVLLLLIISFLSKNSYATSEPYLLVKIGKALIKGKEREQYESGYNSIKVKHDNATVLDGSIGYRINPNIRFSLNMSYLPKWKVTANSSYPNRSEPDLTSNSFHQTHISSLSTTINGYYDITQLSFYNITPYLMTGVGFAINEITDSNNYVDNQATTKHHSHSITNLAWKAGVGINYHLDERLFLDIGYTYTNLGKISSKIATAYPTYIPGDEYENAAGEHDHRLATDMISNKFKKLTSHQFLIGVGIKF